MQDRGPEKLSEILSRLFTARGWGRVQEREQIEQVWREVIGPEYQGQTRLVGLRRRILEVEVRGSITLQELAQFHKRRILAELRQALPHLTITDLRFRAAKW